MANGEKRGDVARALIAHALNVTATSPAERTHPKINIMTRTRLFGEIGTAHHVLPGEREIVDVWHGKKVFSATRYLDSEGWELISFKRGDWESAFLCAA